MRKMTSRNEKSSNVVYKLKLYKNTLTPEEGHVSLSINLSISTRTKKHSHTEGPPCIPELPSAETASRFGLNEK